MSEEPTGMNPDDEDDFERLMGGVNDPLTESYGAVAEMFNGLVMGGLSPENASMLVATYVMINHKMNGGNS